jgi:four helix bundle protein
MGIGGARPDFENLEVYRLAENLANQIWRLVRYWDHFSKETMGRQIVRAADSVCANIAEGRGRYHFKDHQRYIRVARGSLYETVSWLRLAYARHLLTHEQSNQLKPVLEQLLPKLNAYLKSLER